MKTRADAQLLQCAVKCRVSRADEVAYDAGIDAMLQHGLRILGVGRIVAQATHLGGNVATAHSIAHFLQRCWRLHYRCRAAPNLGWIELTRQTGHRKEQPVGSY